MRCNKNKIISKSSGYKIESYGCCLSFFENFLIFIKKIVTLTK